MSLFENIDPNDFADSMIRPACNCECHRKGDMPGKWAIELYKGDATVFRENKNNAISTCQTHWLFLIPYALFKNFSRIGNLLFLFVSLIMMIDPNLSPYYRWIGLFPLLFYTVLNLIKVLYLEFWRRRAGRRVNTLKTRRGKREAGGLDEDVVWKDLKPGDIVYLKKDEIVPADIVLLDTNLPKNKSMICWVDTQNVDGFTSYAMKKAVNATRVEKGSVRKDNYKEYRKILSGKIEHEAPTADMNKFSGYIKLKKDPKPEQFNIENLVLRGSIIRNTDWIFGICVYTGHDTKIMMNSAYNKEKKSYFQKVAERFFIFGVILLILMSVIIMVVLLTDRTQSDFVEQFPENVDFTNILSLIVLFSPSVPISFYAIYDLILLLRKAVMQRKRLRKGKVFNSSSKTPAITVMDPNALPNLGLVDYCFIDKTGTLTTGEYKVKSIYVNSKLYRFNSDIIQTKVTEFREKKGKTSLGSQDSQLNKVTSPKEALQTEFKDNTNVTQQKNPTDTPINISYQSLVELDIADDPEFHPTQGVYNTYKFKEEIDTRVKHSSPGTEKFDFSASKLEISHLPLLGANKTRQIEDLLLPYSPKYPDKTKTLSHQFQESEAHIRGESTQNVLQSGVPSSGDGFRHEPVESMAQKEDDEDKLLMQSPNAYEKDKRVSFQVPDSGLKPIATDSKDFQDPQEKAFTENDYMIDYFTLNDKNIEELTKSLSICHSARSRYIGDEYIYETAYPDELTLLKFAKLFGKSFIVSNRPDNPSEYTVKENGNTMKYKILGVNDFSYSRKRFSVVYRNLEEDSAVTILAKGPAYNMKQALALDKQENEAYDRIVSRFQERGYKAIAIGRKIMKEEEAAEFYKKYQNYKMSLYNQNDDLEALSREVEKGLKLVGIVALQDELRPEASETIKTLKEADVKVWMLTGDNQENAVNTCYVTGLLNKKMDIHNIKLENKEDAKAFIRNILNVVKKQYVGDNNKQDALKKSLTLTKKRSRASMVSKSIFDTTNKLAITIDGDSFDIIFRDPYLKANFTFICALCYTFVGYRFSPLQKKMVLTMVKDHFQDSPVTMAIGDGLNDAFMLRTADISIELRMNKNLLPNNAGDIQLTSLGLIKEIMLVDGRNISDKIEKTIHYTFYTALVVGGPIFFFSFFNGGTGTPLFDSLLIFLYSFVMTFFPVLVYGGNGLSEPKEILLKFPALYIDGKTKKEHLWKTFLVQSLLEGVIHASVVYFLVTFSISVTYTYDGKTSDMWMSALAQFMTIIIITNMKLYWFFKRKKFVPIIMTLITIVFFVIYIFINDGADFVEIDYLREIQALFQRASSIGAMLFAIVFSVATSYTIRHYLCEKVYKSLYDWCADINAGNNIEEISNDAIAMQATKPKDLGATVKNVYKQPELMDPIVHEMLSPADQNVNQLELKKYQLTFLDKRMEKQYKLITSRKAIKLAKVIYALVLFVFGAYSLGESFILQDQVYSFTRLGVFIGFLLFGCLLFTDFYRAQYYEMTLFYIFAFFVAKITFDWTGDDDTGIAAPLLPLASQTIFKVSAFKLGIMNFIYFVIFEIRIMAWYFSNNDVPEFSTNQLLSTYSALSYAFLLIGINAIISYLGHSFEQDLRNEHSSNAKLEIQMNKSNDILSILLPKFIKDKIDKLGGDRNLAEDQGEVSILFCDIMDFDKIILKEGKKVVQLLDYTFRMFDQLCGTYGVQKIETVGKTYMACAGLKSCEIGVAKKILAVHPSRRVLNLALDMEEVVKKMTYGEGIAMRIRIGVHSGRVIAGVIGYHKPQFSLIGDAVNTTSRVCTAKNPGQIRMSDEAYQKMMEAGGAGRNEIYFVPKVEEMKGKGNVKVHIVARKTHSTSFKKKIGQALLKNKEKKVFEVTEKTIPSETGKITNRNHVFQNIKDVLNFKEKLEEEINKANARNSVGTPSSSFIKTMKEDAEEEYADDEDDVTLLKPHKLWLTLPTHARHKASEFESDLLVKKKLFQKLSMFGLFVLYLLQTVFMLVIEEEFENSVVLIVLRIVFLGLLACLGFLYKLLSKKGMRKPISCAIFIYGYLVTLLQAYWTVYPTFHRIQLIELMLLYLVGTHSILLDFMLSFIESLIMSGIFFVTYGLKGILDIQNVFFFVLFTLANLLHVFLYFRMNIKFYNSLQVREKRRLEQSGLVSQLLPVHAAEKYFSDPTGRVDVSDEFEDVTIVYADIKGFTDYSASVEAKDVVTMLSALFTRFDKVCHKYSLYKVYTIGDCYVAISFVNASNRDPGKEASNMVKMAMSMIEIIREVRKEIKFDELDMRIGIHTGNIIGGIVGTDIVRYDIWGQDILIANAMESEGVKGHINVSESTKNLLERTSRGLYRFEPHKVVEMEKIESKVPCYLLYSNQNYEEY